MDLKSEDEHLNNSVNSDTSKAAEPVSFKKIHITPVLKAAEEFLKTTFSPMENGPRRQLRHQFIVPDTPFTSPPHLDKFIVGECSKSTKSNDSFSPTFRCISRMLWAHSQEFWNQLTVAQS